MDKRHVAAFRNNFLPYSETFIHDELRHHVRYHPTVFARTWRNEDRFPGHEVVYLEKIPGETKFVEKFIYEKFRKSWTFDAAFKKNKKNVVMGTIIRIIFSVTFSQRSLSSSIFFSS